MTSIKKKKMFMIIVSASACFFKFGPYIFSSHGAGSRLVYAERLPMRHGLLLDHRSPSLMGGKAMNVLQMSSYFSSGLSLGVLSFSGFVMKYFLGDVVVIRSCSFLQSVVVFIIVVVVIVTVVVIRFLCLWKLNVTGS